ncbi:hypothetical protein EVAR_56538_1 [Eumeta japonica]|uniref:Uncharacterized protein n=1 Tax=Eumeta variegata TaxID=151549 RepID=A0A4C1YUK2_EUMVA|nr:hypothetical protein EVAR_56538_1 [Eumeta japonica]
MIIIVFYSYLNTNAINARAPVRRVRALERPYRGRHFVLRGKAGEEFARHLGRVRCPRSRTAAGRGDDAGDLGAGRRPAVDPAPAPQQATVEGNDHGREPLLCARAGAVTALR